MDKIKTFSLSRHSRLFSVPDHNNQEYLLVKGGETPYQEEPYRAESYAIAFIIEGAVKLTCGLTSREIEAPAIITLAPSTIRYFTKRSDHLKMDVIFFKDTFLLERHSDHFFLAKYNFFENSDHCVLPLKEVYADKLSKIYELIQLTQTTPNIHEREIVRGYIFALVYEIDAYYRQYILTKPVVLKVSPLFNKFRQLLRANYMRERRLDFYAAQLNVTPKSLSAAVKKQTGRSAGEWIDDVVILEAKVLLQNKTLTVSQISNMLNFSDQSVFGKFFRAGTALSPGEYRKKFE
jgi:AraC-like DNA-binding protein